MPNKPYYRSNLSQDLLNKVSEKGSGWHFTNIAEYSMLIWKMIAENKKIEGNVYNDIYDSFGISGSVDKIYITGFLKKDNINHNGQFTKEERNVLKDSKFFLKKKIIGLNSGFEGVITNYFVLYPIKSKNFFEVNTSNVHDGTNINHFKSEPSPLVFLLEVNVLNNFSIKHSKIEHFKIVNLDYSDAKFSYNSGGVVFNESVFYFRYEVSNLFTASIMLDGTDSYNYVISDTFYYNYSTPESGQIRLNNFFDFIKGKIIEIGEDKVKFKIVFSFLYKYSDVNRIVYYLEPVSENKKVENFARFYMDNTLFNRNFTFYDEYNFKINIFDVFHNFSNWETAGYNI